MAYGNCAAVKLRTGAIRQQLPRSIAPDIPWLNKGYQYVDETRIRCDTIKYGLRCGQSAVWAVDVDGIEVGSRADASVCTRCCAFQIL
jgi:hypothetical protein